MAATMMTMNSVGADMPTYLYRPRGGTLSPATE